jgi:hypothetical protein
VKAVVMPVALAEELRAAIPLSDGHADASRLFT